MTEIIPAILPKNFFDLEERLAMLVGLSKFVQIDVCDGKFTPKPSWPYNREDDKQFQEIISEKRGLPHWDDFEFEIDCMISDPTPRLSEWVRAGAARLIVHVESRVDMKQVIENLSDQVEIVAALSLETPIETIDSYADKLSGVQCMGIRKIGFQGQTFDPRVIEKIGSLRTRFKDLTISVDGGVNLETAPLLIEAGANRLVVGSALFESGNIAETIAAFKELR